MGETPFVRECQAALRNLAGSNDLSRLRKELYRELVVGSALDPLSGQRRSSAPIGIGFQVRAFLTIPSSRSPGDLHGTHCPFSAWNSELAW